MEHKDKGGRIGSEAGEQHSIPLKSRADEETYTNTHTADKQVHGKKIFKWSFCSYSLEYSPESLHWTDVALCHCPKKASLTHTLNPEISSEMSEICFI